MEVVVGLLMLLLGVSRGVETFCDGRQDGAQCYAPLGGTLALRLMTSASDLFSYRWFKSYFAILRGAKDKIFSNTFQSRSSFTPSDGTFRISNISWTDDAEYTLVIFDSSGRVKGKRKLNLSVQVPVSAPLLDSECLSQGEMRVSCSSEEGHSPQYSWTLDGHTLMDSQLLSGDNETNNITLKQGVSGQLVCSVNNHVSSASASERISPCEGLIFIDCTLSSGTHVSQWVLEANEPQCVTSTITTATTIKDSEASTMGIILRVAFSLAAVLILLVLVVRVHCAQTIKKNKNAQDAEDDQDVNYVNIRMVEYQGRQRALVGDDEINSSVFTEAV